MSITSANTLMTDAGGSPSTASAYKVNGKKPTDLTNQNKYSAAAKKLSDGADKVLEDFTNWIKTPKMPDSYLAHGGVGPNGQPGSPDNTLLGALENLGTEVFGDGSNNSTPSSSKRTSGGGSGGGISSPVSESNPYEDIIKRIEDISKANNEWSAAQAQKQMDFQKMMSDTAHQRETADLKAAGLNPVLSAGGSGAPVTSGAMGDTDTSNTRLIAEVSMEALAAMTQTAVGVARASKGNTSVLPGILGKFDKAYQSSPLLKKTVDTALNTASSLGRYAIMRTMFSRK